MAQQTQSQRPSQPVSRSAFSAACYNEMYATDGAVRPHYQPLDQWLATTAADRIAQMRQAAQLLGQRLLTSVFLIKALGGDWQPGRLAINR